MGANAQTTVPTFTASQVLTADQMNQSARTGVPVFATTGTRDAGFGGAGEKTLAEGQMCYVEGTGFQTYNGTAWITWGTAPATSGLELVKAQTIGTTVSSITVSDAFNSTYENYRVIVSGGVASTGNNATVTFGATNTGYYQKLFYGNYSNNTVSGQGTSNGTAFFDIIQGSTDSISGMFDVLSPNLAKQTYVFMFAAAGRTDGIAGFQGGYIANSTQYTAFTLTTTSGTFTGGTIRVYGYKN